MFSNPQDGSAKGVMWVDWVHALCDAGFRAISHGGSAVRFEKEAAESEAGGAIVFHKPHPDPKVDSTMLRNMGKRMAKWFGWCRELFCEKDGETEEPK